MQADFDSHATVYDAHFSHSFTGSLYRKLVQDYLLEILPQKSSSILELNCGTGEDAMFFAKLGHTVLATDISSEMIHVAQGKMHLSPFKSNARFAVFDMKSDYPDLGKFDFIFSNFGGLNCLSPIDLEKSLRHFTQLLNPGGRLILVIMPKYCLWESLYFFLRLRWKQMFRRATENPVTVVLDGVPVKTWYYQPSVIQRFLPNLKLERLMPIGIALPTPSMDSLLAGHPKRSSFLLKLENKLKRLTIFAGMADHYLIDLRKA
jgi:SAM-dependent methyltransferase